MLNSSMHPKDLGKMSASYHKMHKNGLKDGQLNGETTLGNCQIQNPVMCVHYKIISIFQYV